MFLTHFMMGWMVLTVLSLCLPVWSVEVIQPYRVVSANGTAQIQCFLQLQPSYHHNPEVLRVTLLKGLHGTKKFCSFFLNLSGQTDADVEKEGEVPCYAQMREGAVEVTVSGLKATDTDMYHCVIEVFYPPPYLHITGNGTLIHVLGSSDCAVLEAQRQITQQGDEEDVEDGDKTAPVSVPVVVLLMLVTFVLLIIIYFQTLQCVRGRREIKPVPRVLHKRDAAGFSCDNIA
ncbi:hypothetical protein PAMP_003490 [Pampus punctatissimus]